MESYRIAIVGATDLVGQDLLRLLEQRRFPISRMSLLATDDTVGRTVYSNSHAYTVQRIEHKSFEEVDIAFFLAGDDASRHQIPLAVKSGATVVDNSTVFRFESNVPLVVADVNPEDIQKHNGIIASPDCSATVLNTVLYPLHKINPIKRVVVSTYQSTSGMGLQAMSELTLQSQQILAGEMVKPVIFPHEIGFNVLPQVDVFLDNGYTREEWHLLDETRKILHDNNILVSATCVRVPTFKGHCQALTIDFSREINEEIAGDVLAKAPAVKVMDNPGINLYPHPRMAAGSDLIYVGRLRQDAFNEKGLALWVVADNIRKGFAMNMVQIAEKINEKGWLKAKGQK